MVPNETVRRPAYARHNLVLSYEQNSCSEGYQYTFSKSALYDNAIAAIALTMAGHREEASSILDALHRVLNKDWDLFFSFNSHNAWPNDQDSFGAVVRSGASAWAGYASCYYLADGLLRNPDLFAEDPSAMRYLEFAERLAERMLVRQVRKSGNPRKGLLTGGKGRYVLRLKDQKVVEEFVPGEVDWCSVEHNIDSTFFYRDLGRLTGKKKWIETAEAIKESLLQNAWNQKLGQFNRGVRKDGPDPVEALDCAFWGASILASWSEKEKAQEALNALKRYESSGQGYSGYKPYAAGPIYESRMIQEHYYPNKKDGVWEKPNLVWPEGSLGAAVAFVHMKEFKGAEKILSNMLKLQTASGGIPYATQHILFHFSKAPSVA